MESDMKLPKEPSMLEDDILRYLSLQADAEEEESTPEVRIYHPSRLSAELCAKEILEGVITAVEWRHMLKKLYEEKLREQNQFDLFDLRKVIPDFNIDDALVDNLVFRETLMIGSFENEYAALPTAAGGLCLDVQICKGGQPLKRYDPDHEKELLEILTKRLEDEIAVKAHKSGMKSEVSFQPSDEDVMGYLDFLRNEMKVSHCKFLVHLSSQFMHEGQNGGSRITAWVDKNFHTLEERRIEYLKGDESLVAEKSIYVGLQKKKYYVVSRTRPGTEEQKRYYSTEKARHLVGEGANFILMRYLAITRYMGEMELSTVYINGDMCRNIYVCSGPESGIVNNKKLDLCKIYRMIIEECGIHHKCCTIMTLQGQLIKQDWSECTYILQVNPIVEVSNTKPGPLEKIPMRNRWEDDMQLFSMYLDKKVASYKLVKTYLLDHPEVKNLIADFFQNILQMKPDMIMEFALDFFAQYLPHKIPRAEYVETPPSDSLSI